MIRTCFLALFLSMFWQQAFAAPMTFLQSSNGGNCNGCEWLAAQGEITANTPQKFEEYIAANGKPYLIVFDSPGGNLEAGVRLGRLIRESGATTSVGKTVQFGDDETNYEDTRPGICASACAFAFMGGVERFLGEADLLGVHQFYSLSPQGIRSDIVQKIVGLTLLYTIEMGIDEAVIVAASSTSSEEMYWFNEQELADFNLDTSRSTTIPWRLEPYKNGLVLTTVHTESVRRSVTLTIFCRADSRRHFLLISEHAPFYANQIEGADLLKFTGKYTNQPTLEVGEDRYRIAPANLEFQRIDKGNFYLSIQLPSDIAEAGGEVISFQPDLARVYGSLVSASVELPSAKWISTLSSNCI